MHPQALPHAGGSGAAATAAAAVGDTSSVIPLSPSRKCEGYPERLLQAGCWLGVAVDQVQQWLGSAASLQDVQVQLVTDGQVQPQPYRVAMTRTRDSLSYHIAGSELHRAAAGKWFLGLSRPSPGGPLHLLLRTATQQEMQGARSPEQQSKGAETDAQTQQQQVAGAAVIAVGAPVAGGAPLLHTPPLGGLGPADSSVPLEASVAAAAGREAAARVAAAPAQAVCKEAPCAPEGAAGGATTEAGGSRLHGGEVQEEKAQFLGAQEHKEQRLVAQETAVRAAASSVAAVRSLRALDPEAADLVARALPRLAATLRGPDAPVLVSAPCLGSSSQVGSGGHRYGVEYCARGVHFGDEGVGRCPTRVRILHVPPADQASSTRVLQVLTPAEFLGLGGQEGAPGADGNDLRTDKVGGKRLAQVLQRQPAPKRSLQESPAPAPPPPEQQELDEPDAVQAIVVSTQAGPESTPATKEEYLRAVVAYLRAQWGRPVRLEELEGAVVRPPVVRAGMRTYLKLHSELFTLVGDDAGAVLLKRGAAGGVGLG
ncbi:hypothetical protein Agub_g8173 [Astrephomene gubernaculifera]|uniref:Uncharacterized protein n=1 Tax=Astrephomene gubernaculifera TaxID=47775 RepID=A0AAD3DR84_9CHLO|nr:hypothetical protein Agub_g8173 [Astrephomene gubernaculifera]